MHNTHFNSLCTPELRDCIEYEVTDSSSEGQGFAIPRQTLAAQIDIAASMEGGHCIDV